MRAHATEPCPMFCVDTRLQEMDLACDASTVAMGIDKTFEQALCPSIVVPGLWSWRTILD